MVEAVQRLDVWLAVITLAAMAWFLGVLPLLDWLGIDLAATLRRLATRQSVKTSDDAGARYVAPRAEVAPRSAPFPPERERERERERPERADPPLPALDGKIYTPEQIEALKADARDTGAAEALGRLIGRGLLAPDDRATAMELIFGPRGRRHQRVRPLIEAAAASAAPPAPDARLVPINGGQRGHIELN